MLIRLAQGLNLSILEVENLPLDYLYDYIESLNYNNKQDAKRNT